MTLLKMKNEYRHVSKWEHRYNVEMRERKTLFAKFFLVSMVVGIIISTLIQVAAWG